MEPAPELSLRINRAASGIESLGPARRFGLWVQGCTIGCSGCASADTWNVTEGISLLVSELAATITRTMTTESLSGLTITGGEPFQQSHELASLILRLRNQTGWLPDWDILIFTGYTRSRAETISPELWNSADALIAGPYVQSRPSDRWLIASENQHLHVNSELGRARYLSSPELPRCIQVTADSADLTIAGLPDPGDLDKFRALMIAKGIDFEEVSWQK